MALGNYASVQPTSIHERLYLQGVAREREQSLIREAERQKEATRIAQMPFKPRVNPVNLTVKRPMSSR